MTWNHTALFIWLFQFVMKEYFRQDNVQTTKNKDREKDKYT